MTAFQILMLVLTSGLPLFAQQPLSELISVAGTTAVDPKGQNWAYLSWGSPTLATIKNQPVSVYSKSGSADSPDTYQRRAITGVQTDPLVIEALLDRAALLGHSREALHDHLDALFGELTLGPALTLGARLSAVIRGAMSDPRHCENLVILARQHAGVGFCLGIAHAERIDGPPGTRTTFELRFHNPARQEDQGVMGRVTVTAGQPLVLPAPGRPMETIDVSPKGDLNVKLLWATPAPLRRLLLASYGYNVYRIDAATTEAQGLHLAAPSVATLRNLVQAGQNAFRLNRTPVLVDRLLDDAELPALAADVTNYFFSDSNDRATPDSGPPQAAFHNGAEFYYFITARDVLGRDGLVSPGRKVRVCDRMPPPPPLYVRVENVYAHDPVAKTSARRLKVIWRRNVDEAPERTTGYHVHRWNSLRDMHQLSTNPLAGRITGVPVVPADPAARDLEFVDTTPGAPSSAFNVGSTIWYTVRAIDAGACAPGGNISFNSSPAFGVIRDFEGPSGGGGGIRIRCVRPTVSLKSPAGSEPDPLGDTGVHDYRLRCERTSGRVKHVDFLWWPAGVPSQRRVVGRRFFAPGTNTVEIHARWRLSEFGAGTRPHVVCRATLDNGKTLETGLDLDAPANPGLRVFALFEAGATTQLTGPDTVCRVHDPVPDDGPGAGLVDPVWVDLSFPAGTREWRLYRRVDDSPVTLIEQGEGNFGVGDVLPVRDSGIPANACELCYFIQYFDEHGNGGPLLPIGCVRSEGTVGLPTPVLSTLQPLGTINDPQMELKWTCPVGGVERFEVWVGGTPLPPPLDLSPDLSADTSVPPMPIFGTQAGRPSFLFRRYTTRRIGPSHGPGPVFTTSANCRLGNRWRVFVHAVSPTGAVSPRSNIESFRWTMATNPTPEVPWPARPLPEPSAGQFFQVTARFIAANVAPANPWEGNAIRIGTVNIGLSTDPLAGEPDRYLSHTDPSEHVYKSPSLEPLLPVVLYRWQETNSIYPHVSGDVIQVSPMIHKIAWQAGTLPGNGSAALIRDPFIRLFQEDPLPVGDQRIRGIYLLDTQPVLEGATYRYSLVRFSEQTREPVEVITTNPVSVP